jgi:hypothetical protein
VGTEAGDPGAPAAGPDTPGTVGAYKDSRTSWMPASVFTDRPGSAVDEGATFKDLGERSLSRELIDNLIDSQRRWWRAGAPAAGSTWARSTRSTRTTT